MSDFSWDVFFREVSSVLLDVCFKIEQKRKKTLLTEAVYLALVLHSFVSSFFIL